MTQLTLTFPRRFEIPASQATIAGGIVTDAHGVFCLDLSWPWWRPYLLKGVISDQGARGYRT